METRSRLEALMAERILVLEGPKGTAIQTLELSEEDFRGDLLRDHPRDVRGNNDILGLTRPDLVEGGVDVLQIETIFDTLNAKAAIAAGKDVAPQVPLWLLFTAVDQSGR